MARRPRRPTTANEPPTTVTVMLSPEYGQVHLADAHAGGDLGDAWTAQAVRDLVAVAEGIVGIGCVRTADVRVVVELLSAAPPDELGGYEHVTEASLHVPSGELAVLGCTDYLPDAARLRVPAEPLRVRAAHAGLSKGRETVRVQLWPAPSAEPAVLLRWSPPVKAPKRAAKTKDTSSSTPKPVRNVKQARLLALRGQPQAALEALLRFADAGDASASASAAELLAFEGRWAEVLSHATALLTKPESVYAGNVFDDMCALVRRAARELGDPEAVQRAAAMVPPARQARVAYVLLQDSPLLSARVDEPDAARFAQAVEKAATDKRWAGEPQQLARHCFALAVAFRVQDEIIARFDPANPLLHFDAAVSAACALVRRGEPAAAWAALETRLHDWWPVDKAQVAPVVLVTHALLTPLMTEERRARVLATPRAGES